MTNIIVKEIIYEDFVNYRKPSMFLALGKCDFKCCVELGISPTICQNSKIAIQQDIEVSFQTIGNRYKSNPISEAIVFGGLEVMLSFGEVLPLIEYLRIKRSINDDIVIYTGYYPDEIQRELEELKQYHNIIVKFGRYIPHSEKVFDDILGVWLASKNQWAERIS